MAGNRMPRPDSLITMRCVKDTMSTTDNEHLPHSTIKKALEIIVDYFHIYLVIVSDLHLQGKLIFTSFARFQFSSKNF